MRGKRQRGESSERSTAPQMITEFLFKKKETEKKMHKKRNMHDFPIYHCLTSFEHVCKDLRGRMGKEEFGRGGWPVDVCLGAVEPWSGGLGQTAR